MITLARKVTKLVRVVSILTRKITALVRIYLTRARKMTILARKITMLVRIEPKATATGMKFNTNYD